MATTYRNGIPKAAWRALDYSAASIGTILREGPPKDGEGFAKLASELELIRQLCRCAMDYGDVEPKALDSFSERAVRDVMVG